jgi:hypothetical protein
VVGAHLGDIVKAGLETVGPKITQTSLTVEAVHVSLLGGQAGIQGLVLGNPEGYQAPSSICLSNAAVTLVPGSILADKIVIHSITVSGLEVNFEGNPFGANNLSQIMANASGGAGAAKAPVEPAEPAAKKPAKKLEVDDFLITGAKIHANLTGLIHRQLTLPLPDIHLTGLGTGPEGITAADLIKQVLGEITIGTIKTLVNSAAGLGKDAAGAAKNLLKDAAGGVLQNPTNALGQGLDKLKQGLGGLLGK